MTEPQATPCTDAEPSIPCFHKGRAIRSPSFSPDPRIAWSECDHPLRLQLGIAKHVCPCIGCNARCPGYDPENAPPEEIEHVPV